jgi:hypothetical protein
MSSDETTPAIERKSSSVVPVTLTKRPSASILTKSPVAMPAYTVVGLKEK